MWQDYSLSDPGFLFPHSQCLGCSQLLQAPASIFQQMEKYFPEPHNIILSSSLHPGVVLMRQLHCPRTLLTIPLMPGFPFPEEHSLWSTQPSTEGLWLSCLCSQQLLLHTYPSSSPLCTCLGPKVGQLSQQKILEAEARDCKWLLLAMSSLSTL